MIVYFYDLKTSLKEYNKIKRRFYYYLKKNDLNKYFWKTKSALVVPEDLERSVDGFFKNFKKTTIVYKIHCQEIEEL
ncbi:MAG: hypothetical protein QXH30_00235 [Candidatus Bilamarchaeaceae archaeon]